MGRAATDRVKQPRALGQHRIPLNRKSQHGRTWGNRTLQIQFSATADDLSRQTSHRGRDDRSLHFRGHRYECFHRPVSGHQCGGKEYGEGRYRGLRRLKPSAGSGSGLWLIGAGCVLVADLSIFDGSGSDR